MKDRRPLVVITAGDNAGIGPEIILKALSDPELYDICRPAVVGTAEIFRQTQRCLAESCPEAAALKITQCSSEGLGEIPFRGTELSVFNVGKAAAGLRFGEPTPENGRLCFEYIEAAVKIIKKHGGALCTAPINKQAVRLGGIDFKGHTEMLEALTGCRDPLTVFVTGRLMIFFLTRHVPLSEVPGLITKERVTDYIERSSSAMRQLGRSGALAVAALNPHCSDNGLFGGEEKLLEEAVKCCAAEGLEVVGPISADSVFYECSCGRYAAVLSLYHDQGHIAAKTLDFHRTVSVTAGLPFIRTSVDHGTAYDIAGKGLADASGMSEAIKRAAEFGAAAEKG